MRWPQQPAGSRLVTLIALFLFGGTVGLHAQAGGDEDEVDGGGIQIAELVQKLPRTARESRALRRRALENSLLAGNLVARDGRAAAILVELAPRGNTFAGKIELTTAYQEFSILFTTPVGDQDNARLMFWLANHDQAGNDYFVDDVVLELIGP